MKQHPDSIARDLEDEIADVIEHQYARKLVKSVTRDDTTAATNEPADDAAKGLELRGRRHRS
ncbi:hypothetical protein [Bradyrhizobium sp. LHD-71]|uniref:hypothetical protein n=1 Tax=Bradyrhizobium sp. LHD-71 TaxID=3072141 RepID=UPI00280FCFBA|nr:hypothetical protein [Bradyrhizobium sp. LHD-71]MDQ8729384.1 hypothetical protein [Bradyrhizobium sp. LHD-71]